MSMSKTHPKLQYQVEGPETIGTPQYRYPPGDRVGSITPAEIAADPAMLRHLIDLSIQISHTLVIGISDDIAANRFLTLMKDNINPIIERAS